MINKKSFTLIELIIVVLIIGMLISTIGLLSWNYITHLNNVNYAETVKSAFSFIKTTALSQPTIGATGTNYDFLGIYLKPGSHFIEIRGFTGNYSNQPSKIDTLKLYELGSAYIGSGFELVKGIEKKEYNSGIYLLYEPYRINHIIVVNEGVNNWSIKTGEDYQLKFNIFNKEQKIACFVFYNNNGRIDQLNCENKD